MKREGWDEYPHDWPDAQDLADVEADRAAFWRRVGLEVLSAARGTIADCPQTDEGTTAP